MMKQFAKNKNGIIILGLLSVLPLLNFLYQVISVFIGDQYYFPYKYPILLLIVGLISLFIAFYYIYLCIGNSHITEIKKVIWVLLLIFFGLIFWIVYWYIHIYKEAKK